MRRIVFLISLVTVYALLPVSYAEVPPAFSYQCILKDSTGAPVEDDVYAIKFAIYDDSVTGSILWETSGFVPIQTRDGLFTHVLGSTNPIPDSIARYDALWAGLRVNLEPEMTPRTRLTSVPFALTAEYADTATVSLDKTINASELITGVLDTARFSAYRDLLSENKVGPTGDQVAAGDHVHTGVSFPGTMVRFEDTLAVTGAAPIGKSITIPGETVSHFFRISFPIRLNESGASGDLFLTVNANGQLIHSSRYSLGPSLRISVEIITSKLSGNIWLAHTNSFGFGYQPFGQIYEFIYETPSGLDIEVYLTCNTSCNLTIGNLIVEYDVE